MPDSIPTDSVGLVTPQVYKFDEPLTLRSGRVLPEYELVVETYGKLNSEKTNAVLICHALSGDHHAAGYHSEKDSKPGWWDSCIGPGKAIDTDLFYVVSLNNLGGCAGSTGPASINPETNKYYGPDFPVVTVRDWVNSQLRLMEAMEIPVWAAVVGGSLGGMQVLRWTISYPDKVRHAVCIAAAPKLSAQNIAFNEVARHSITSDRDFHEGRYLEKGTYPKRGLMLARMVGHITYLSDSAMRAKFGKSVSNFEQFRQRPTLRKTKFRIRCGFSGRELSALSGRTILRKFRCKYLFVDDKGARLLRPHCGFRRRSVEGICQ